MLLLAYRLRAKTDALAETEGRSELRIRTITAENRCTGVLKLGQGCFPILSFFFFGALWRGQVDMRDANAGVGGFARLDLKLALPDHWSSQPMNLLSLGFLARHTRHLGSSSSPFSL